MKHIKLFLSLTLFLSGFAMAQDQGIGVGLSTRGLEGKYWMDGETSVTLSLSASSIAADYLFNMPDLVKLTDNPTPVYYGGGLIIGTHEEWDSEEMDDVTKLDLGARGVIGIAYYFSGMPLEIYFLDTPTLYLMGGKGLNLFEGSLGIRYFF